MNVTCTINCSYCEWHRFFSQFLLQFVIFTKKKSDFGLIGFFVVGHCLLGTDQQAAAGFYCERASLKLLLPFLSFLGRLTWWESTTLGQEILRKKNRSCLWIWKLYFSCEFVKYRFYRYCFLIFFLFWLRFFLSLLIVSLLPNGGTLWSSELFLFTLLLLSYCNKYCYSYFIVILHLATKKTCCALWIFFMSYKVT